MNLLPKNGTYCLIFHLLSIGLLLHPNATCSGQETKSHGEKIISRIILNDAADGSFEEYLFYDEAGSIVKRIRHNQFESKSPIFKLDALNKNKSKDTLPDYFHLLELIDDEDNQGMKILHPKVVKELISLKKHGIIVKTPEKADVIIGSPTSNERPINISMPKGRFLINVETSIILDYSAKEIEGRSNALLDCSYITIYTYLGEVFKEVLISDKIITYGVVSDDGNYLMCSYSYTHLWDEGYDEIPDGIIVIDLASGEIATISIPATRTSFGFPCVLFADNYFQMTSGNPWSGESCIRMYINPYEKKYYLKSYDSDSQRKRKAIFPQSFIQFEGIIESIDQFEVFSY